eukprot:6968572-Pyramimonas_sp.AAC.1
MDHPLFPDYHAQVSGTPRVGTQPENPYVRATADDFYKSQLTRGSGYASGVPGQTPHYGYLVPPMDQDVQQQAPSLVTPASSPAMAASMQLPTSSPIPCEAGESTPGRQMRIRPAATPPIISDGDFSKCAICLDLFMNHDKVWRLQCGHRFHAQCWDRV